MVKQEQTVSACIYDPSLRKRVTRKISITKTRNLEEATRLLEDWRNDMVLKAENYYETVRARGSRVVDVEDPRALPSDNPEIPFRKFEIKFSLEKGKGQSIVLYGSSKSGKSTIITHLVNNCFPIDDLITCMFLGNPMAPVYTFDEPKKLIIADYFQSELINYAHKINKKTKNKYPFLFITDDIIDQKFNNVLKSLILTYRNASISSLTSIQDSVLMTRMLRSNVNYACFLKIGNAEGIEILIKQYLRPYLRKGSIRDQVIQYQELTSDYKFLVLNLNEGKLYQTKI